MFCGEFERLGHVQPAPGRGQDHPRDPHLRHPEPLPDQIGGVVHQPVAHLHRRGHLLVQLGPARFQQTGIGAELLRRGRAHRTVLVDLEALVHADGAQPHLGFGQVGQGAQAIQHRVQRRHQAVANIAAAHQFPVRVLPLGEHLLDRAADLEGHGRGGRGPAAVRDVLALLGSDGVQERVHGIEQVPQLVPGHGRMPEGAQILFVRFHGIDRTVAHSADPATPARVGG
ncbi:DUF742 domain-containing protein [Nocardia sp. ET3-3]|uniref:DUF742 domain-containing protein n=1 Tax=Nocardia terrae TaxID=2675851 RepID=A0A7K1V0I1_9NOCA|nr:DUF742 domain-containing protein [Nocardia terrae]